MLNKEKFTIKPKEMQLYYKDHLLLASILTSQLPRTVIPELRYTSILLQGILNYRSHSPPLEAQDRVPLPSPIRRSGRVPLPTPVRRSGRVPLPISTQEVGSDSEVGRVICVVKLITGI